MTMRLPLQSCIQAEKGKHAHKMSAATEAQQQAELAAARDKQRADDLQHQLVAAQQEQQRSAALQTLSTDAAICSGHLARSLNMPGQAISLPAW